jgi:hypothetical protein
MGMDKRENGMTGGWIFKKRKETSFFHGQRWPGNCFYFNVSDFQARQSPVFRNF